jgi:hypothetical protein
MPFIRLYSWQRGGKSKEGGNTLHRRIIIKRHYNSEGFDFLYDVKVTNLAIPDFARFDESVPATAATHTHDYLLELLTEMFGEESARQFLKDAMRGDTVKTLMPSQTNTRLLDKLKTSSPKVGETV